MIEIFKKKLSGYIIFGYKTRNLNKYCVYIELSQKQDIKTRKFL